MSEWSIPLDKLADKYKVKLETVARKATFDLFTAVNLRSPVDTGRFRANWNVSYGAPDYTATVSTTQSRAGAEIAKVLQLPVGGMMYMSNGLPYGPRLEYDSWSKQAPSGMIRVSVREFRDYVNRAIK